VTVARTRVNGGPAAARNAGIAASSTPLIALLDADDVWLPDHLETMMSTYERRGGVVTSDMLRWVPGEALGRKSGAEGLGFPPPDEQLDNICRWNFVFTGAMFPKDLFDRLGGFRTQFFSCEDWDLWLRMIRSGERFSLCDHPTVLYRLSSGSITASDRVPDDAIAVLETALREASGPDEVRSLRRGLRPWRANRELFRAYRLAEEGHRLRSRVHGLAALGGTRRVAVRGLGIALAPRRVAARREQVREDLTTRLTT
jgi:hypothetical protein